jgi:lauroyl/myristoyl acyltransferase
MMDEKKVGLLLHRTAHQDRKSEKGFLFFCSHFWHFEKSPVLCRAKGIERNFLSHLANPQAVRGGRVKRNFHKFPPVPACVVL